MKYTLLLSACAIVLAGCSDDDSSSSGDNLQTINADNYEAILLDAVSVANLFALNTDVDTVQQLTTAIAPRALPLGSEDNPEELSSRGLTLASEETFEGGIRESYTCDAGGSIVLIRYDSEARHGFESDACYIGTDLYDGNYDSTTDLRGGYSNYNALSVTSPDGDSFSINGRYDWFDGRIGIDRNKVWSDTEYVSSDSMGELLRLTDLDRERRRTVSAPGFGDSLGDTAGYVALDDGSVGLVVPNNDTESVKAGVSFTSPATNSLGMTIEMDLALKDIYYTWYNQNTEDRDNFVNPDFPVIDLGSPLTIQALDSGDILSVEQTAQRGADAEWDGGSLLVTAPDGSHVSMGPSADNPSMVEVRVNNAEEPILRERSEGFQVSCPGQYDECG